MANTSNTQVPLNTSDISRLTTEHDEFRSRNREQLITQLERVIEEKNTTIFKLEEREHYLDDALKKRNAEFRVLEEQLKQFEEKTRTFENLHHLQVQTFEKTIRDCQIENDRLCEQISDLTRELKEKSSLGEINREKVLTFDRIVADTQLWRQKLDSYKETIEQREETIKSLKSEINDLHRRKQTNCEFEDSSLRLQISSLQNTVRERDNEIETLKLTLRRVRDTLQPNPISHESRWKSCGDNIGGNHRTSSPSCDIEFFKKKAHSLNDRLTNVHQLLVKRDNQIVSLKRVHDKRWLRLKHLQKQYNSLKDELQSYTDDEVLQRNLSTDFFYRKAIRKTRNGCSVCNDQRWRKQTGNQRKILKQEDDDHVWNEVTKLRRENHKLTNENLSLQEKIDLQEVELNEQTMVIGELRNEIQRLSDFEEKSSPSPLPAVITIDNEQKQLIEELDKRLYELETERTNLIFEQERLKTNFDLCTDEKQHLLQQKTQINAELKKSKLRILALQDQLHRLKRDQQLNYYTKKESVPNLSIRRRTLQKKPKKISTATKSCLEILLDQNATIIDDLQNESLVSHRVRKHSCSLCDHQTNHALIKRKRRPSILSTISKTRYLPVKRCSTAKSRLSTPLEFTRKASVSSSTQKSLPVRGTTLHKRIEQLEGDLARSRETNRHLNQRLTTTLSRIEFLKGTNQKLLTDAEKFRANRLNQTADSTMAENSLSERLKNASFDAAQQRKMNKSLQINNDMLNKNLQSLTEKLTHTERDIASKRSLIDNYKTRLNEMETSLNRSNEKSIPDNDEERVRSLTETMEKLRITIDSYKNRVQAVTREKHDLDTRYIQLNEEHQKLKIRYEDAQTKLRLNDQQLRHSRLSNDQLNEQIFTVNNRGQESLKKITVELERTLQRLKDYERFINTLFHELAHRNTQVTENLKRAREHQKHRDSLSTTLPGYDTAMHTASRILNLTQDDLDEIMSVTDDSFQINKTDTRNQKEKLAEKIGRLLHSKEECASQLLKIFVKKLDELQATDRELATIRHA